LTQPLTPLPLGYITTASFSCARGAYHGLAVLGAARFLSAVADCRTTSLSTSGGNGAAVLVRGLDGTKQIQLLVQIGPISCAPSEKCVVGSISLLL
jgi:hypothetical protein